MDGFRDRTKCTCFGKLTVIKMKALFVTNKTVNMIRDNVHVNFISVPWTMLLCDARDDLEVCNTILLDWNSFDKLMILLS